jgi:hypothetical protein
VHAHVYTNTSWLVLAITIWCAMYTCVAMHERCTYAYAHICACCSMLVTLHMLHDHLPCLRLLKSIQCVHIQRARVPRQGRSRLMSGCLSKNHWYVCVQVHALVPTGPTHAGICNWAPHPPDSTLHCLVMLQALLWCCPACRGGNPMAEGRSVSRSCRCMWPAHQRCTHQRFCVSSTRYNCGQA